MCTVGAKDYDGKYFCCHAMRHITVVTYTLHKAKKIIAIIRTKNIQNVHVVPESAPEAILGNPKNFLGEHALRPPRECVLIHMDNNLAPPPGKFSKASIVVRTRM